MCACVYAHTALLLLGRRREWGCLSHTTSWGLPHLCNLRVCPQIGIRTPDTPLGAQPLGRGFAGWVSVYPLCGTVTLGDGEGGVGMEVPQSEKEEESLITPAGCGLRQEQIESLGVTLPSSAHS